MTVPGPHLKVLEALGKDSLSIKEVCFRLYGNDHANRPGVYRMILSLVTSGHVVRGQRGMEYTYRKAKA